jgi:hypothetical protein
MVQEPSEIIEWSRQVLVLQALEVAQHLVLGVVGVEHRVGEDGVARSRAGRGAAGGDGGVERGRIGRGAEGLSRAAMSSRVVFSSMAMPRAWPSTWRRL